MRHADNVTVDYIIDLRKLRRENEAVIKRLADHNQLEHLK
jgi:hypothetical protein